MESPRGKGSAAGQPPAGFERAPAEFVKPKWAAAPGAVPAGSVLEEVGGSARHDISGRSSYVVGRVATADLLLEHQSVSRHHAALVHHENGRLYVIDLNSAFGTTVNGKKLEKHKPTKLGANVRFGEGPLFNYRGAKRPTIADGSEPAAKRSRPAAAHGEPHTVQCRDLLVKHRDSRNPRSSNPRNDREETLTRTIEEAEAAIDDILARLKADPTITLEALATIESDCASAKRGGDLGPFGRAPHGPKPHMTPAFESAAFALQVGEMSGPVATSSGVHIIERMA